MKYEMKIKAITELFYELDILSLLLEIIKSFKGTKILQVFSLKSMK